MNSYTKRLCISAALPLAATVLLTGGCGSGQAPANPPGGTAPGARLPAGMFATMGNQVVDQNGNPIRLACVYWPGMNADDSVLDNQTSPFYGIQANMATIAATGFNCVRVDINNASLHDSGSAAFMTNLEQVVAAAAADDIRVIICDHDNEGQVGSNPSDDCTAQQANGLWYDLGGASNGTDGCGDAGRTTQAGFQSDWVSIATQFANNNTVLGYDLWNEPIANLSVWGGGSARDIHQMYDTVGSAMLAKDASKLIFAECPLAVYAPQTLFDGTTVSSAPWGDCTGVRILPVVFNVAGQTVTNKVVYDVHLYPNSIDGYNYLFGSSSSSAAITAMNKSFGFLESQNIAPVWDGESGTGFAQNPDDQNWANMLVQYLNGELGSQGGPTFSGNQQGMGIAWMSWSTSFGSGSDDLGILNSNGSRIEAQMQIVQPLLYYPK